MTVLGVSHLAIGVGDMDKILPFYTDVLGFHVTSDFEQEIKPEQGPDLHKGRHIRRRQVWLRHGEGPQAMAIALDQLFMGGPADHRADIYDQGLHHCGMWVDNIEEIVARAKAGGHPVLMPHVAPVSTYGDKSDEGRIASVFLKDPEGNILQCDQRVPAEGIPGWRDAAGEIKENA